MTTCPRCSAPIFYAVREPGGLEAIDRYPVTDGEVRITGEIDQQPRFTLDGPLELDQAADVDGDLYRVHACPLEETGS